MSTLIEGAIIQNRYRVVRQIGQGGFGAVYEAVDQRLNSRIALKQLLLVGDEVARAFRREAELLANLRHPALPNVMDFFTEESGQFLVMQYIPGDDLGALLAQRETPFPVDETLHWADQLLGALTYLHTRTPPILHRDIKPQNLKLVPPDEIVLLDFGLAKGWVVAAAGVTTGRSIMAYTPGFAPLEQIQGQGTTAQSDLYALAATLHYLLTNTPPVDAVTRSNEVRRQRPDPLRPVHELNPRVSEAVSLALMEALALDAEDRPATAAQMRAALRTARGSTTVVPRASDATVVEALQPRTADATVVEPLPSKPIDATVVEALPPKAADATVVEAPPSQPPPARAVEPLPSRPAEATVVEPLPSQPAQATVVEPLLLTARNATENEIRDAPQRVIPPEEADAVANAAPSTAPRGRAWLLTAVGGLLALALLYAALVVLRPSPGTNENGSEVAAEAGLAAADSTAAAPDSSASDDGAEVTEQTLAASPPVGRIAYTSDADGDRDIYVMSADGSEPTLLTDNDADDELPAWSPDGQRIAFVSDRDDQHGIYVMNADGTDPTLLTEPNAGDYDPAWSADGQQIVFTSERDGQPEIYVMNADGSYPARLTDNGANNYEAAWSPDGQKIAFCFERDDISEIYVMNADGTEPAPLTDLHSWSCSPAWSPDGQQIVFFSDLDDNLGLYMMDADGSDTVRLAETGPGAYGPTWSPDGQHIAFFSDREDNADIYVTNPDGSVLTPLTDTDSEVADREPAWSPVE